MARVSVADERLMEELGLAFEEVPDIDTGRRSKWDAHWEAAVELCRKHEGKTLRVRTYTNASSSYKDAKDINNNESRYVVPEDGETWAAVAAKTGNKTEDSKGNEVDEYAIWLTLNGS